MKRHLIIFLLFSAVGYSEELSLRLTSNAPAIHWAPTGGIPEVLKIEIYVENRATHDVTVLTAPKRVLNWNSFKAIYWYDLEGLGGQLIAPNPYKLRPIRVPKGALAMIDEIEIPVAEISKEIAAQEHVTFEVAYEIDPSVHPYLAVWTGKISAKIAIK